MSLGTRLQLHYSGCCRVCAGDKDSWAGAGLFGGVQMDDDARERILRIRAKGKKEKKGGKKGKKEDKGEMGLQLLFGG